MEKQKARRVEGQAGFSEMNLKRASHPSLLKRGFGAIIYGFWPTFALNLPLSYRK